MHWTQGSCCCGKVYQISVILGQNMWATDDLFHCIIQRVNYLFQNYTESHYALPLTPSWRSLSSPLTLTLMTCSWTPSSVWGPLKQPQTTSTMRSMRRLPGRPLLSGVLPVRCPYAISFCQQTTWEQHVQYMHSTLMHSIQKTHKFTAGMYNPTFGL